MGFHLQKYKILIKNKLLILDEIFLLPYPSSLAGGQTSLALSTSWHLPDLNFFFDNWDVSIANVQNACALPSKVFLTWPKCEGK